MLLLAMFVYFTDFSFFISFFLDILKSYSFAINGSWSGIIHFYTEHTVDIA